MTSGCSGSPEKAGKHSLGAEDKYREIGNYLNRTYGRPRLHSANALIGEVDDYNYLGQVVNDVHGQ